jgi:hypothetical protein
MQARRWFLLTSLIFAVGLLGNGCGVTTRTEQPDKAQFTQATAPRRQAAVAPAATFAPNYARARDMNGLFQWQRFPLRVFFDTGEAYTLSRERAARAGFDFWSRGTNGVIGYRVVKEARQADVTVRFIPDEYVPGQPGTVGHTEVRILNKRWLVRARMVLAVGRIAFDDLPGLAAHEWGHALGIQGHSDDPDDLMYASTTRYVRPDGTYVPGQRARTVTTRDLNTIRTSYQSLFRTSGRTVPSSE